MPNPDSDLLRKARALPHAPGVYLMKDRFGQVIYVGKAKDLRKRVATYFQPSRRFAASQPKIAAMVAMIRNLDHLPVRSEAEALLLEGKLIKEHKPKYNTDFVDDKQFLRVRVDLQNELPRFRLTRNRRNDGGRYFGPFAHAGMLRSTLLEMRKRFGILLAEARPRKLPDGRYRLYDDARAEIFVGHNETTPEEYRERVEQACEFLDGKAREWLRELEEEMVACAERREFEWAAELRDLTAALRETISPTRKFSRDALKAPEDSGEALEGLRTALELVAPPRIIECFDVSHVSGTFVVGSMVRFRDGLPDKANYRRYKIRSFVGNDDFRAMEEVVGRRYRRLSKEGHSLPDLVVVDGGKGQVGFALRAFLASSIEPPPLIGLAKKEERIEFPDDRKPVVLSRRDPALRLLQRLRDESHRFANHFNAEWRSRKIRESALDDFPGLGPVRKGLLLSHFGTYRKLQKASEEELLTVKGIGPVLSKELHLFLLEGKLGQ
ncbi:MAG: excinuclease ABC subunit C [Opitutales bacterium]|nr:excinuclease ABC subunit C [Opitutales bacterium]